VYITKTNILAMSLLTTNPASLHALLLLSDSALPLGSFAFSSGLESFLAHRKQFNTQQRTRAFNLFLEHSLSNLASTALPYVFSAYHDSTALETLDNDVDASTPCTVARRASIAQGKALLTIWERAFALAVPSDGSAAQEAASNAISAFAIAAKTSKPDSYGLQINGHFPPLFGAVAFALGLTEQETCYLFLLNHCKAMLSAAVRASVMGPYQSQATLASTALQKHINDLIAKHQHSRASDAAVCVPAMDLWMGRHELLYSRIFNS
jgi:urease accessory protein